MFNQNEEVKNYIEKLRDAIVSGDSSAAKEAAEALKAKGLTASDVLNAAIRPAMDEVGRKYENLEIFLPDLVLAGDAAQEALNILIPKEGIISYVKGKVVIGTIYGDIHDIGKNIVASMLRTSGYEVIDLGHDVHPDRFVEVAKKENTNIIAISCLLTPSMFYMKDIIRRLVDEGIRNKFFVIIGGAAVYPDWAKEIGADGWAKDAERGVQLCDLLMEKGKEIPKPVILGEWL